MICSRISTILSSFDLFAAKPSDTFMINGEKKYSTFATRVFTLILLSIIFSFCLYYLLEFVQKNNHPDLLMYESLSNNKYVQLNKSTFFILMGLKNKLKGNIFINETIYKPEVCLETKKYGGEIDCRLLTVGVCSDSDIVSYKENPKLFLQLNQSQYYNMYCFKNTTEFSLMGSFGSFEYQSLKIRMLPCPSTDNKNNCAKNETIKNVLSNIQFIIKYVSTSLDPFDLLDPLKGYITEYFVPLEFGKTTQTFLSFTPIVIKSTLNSEEMPLIEGAQYNIEKYSSYRDDTPLDGVIHISYISLTSNVKTIWRNYGSIQEIAPKLGGIINIIFILGKLISSGYANAALYWELTESLYNKNDKENKRTKLSFRKYVQDNIFRCKKKNHTNKDIKIIPKKANIIDKVKNIKQFLDISFLLINLENLNRNNFFGNLADVKVDKLKVDFDRNPRQANFKNIERYYIPKSEPTNETRQENKIKKNEKNLRNI